MTTDNFRSVTTNAAFPLTLRTKGGKEYTVRTAHSMWLPEEYPDTLLLARTGQGVVFLAIDAIESVHPEYETAPAGG